MSFIIIIQFSNNLNSKKFLSKLEQNTVLILRNE